MNRRSFLASGSALTLAALYSNPLSAKGRPANRSSADAQLNNLFDRIFDEQISTNPSFATQLGLDKGKLAPLRSKLDTRSFVVARREEIARTHKFIGWLEAFPEKGLSQRAALNREIVLWDLRTQNVGPERFEMGTPQLPYLISQRNGAYFDTPDFLNSTHPIESATDAEAYLSRLTQFATLLDRETDEQRRQGALGIVAPAWSIDLALGQIGDLREPKPAENTLTQSIATRTRDKKIPGDWTNRAAKIVELDVYPALDRQIALLKQLRATSPAGDGVWRLPNGAAIYAAALKEATTTDLTPEEVHQLGLAQVAEISAELDKILRLAGMNDGTIGERLAKLNVAADQLYPNDDAGRSKLIADLNLGVKSMTARLPKAFKTLPNQPLKIRRVPPEIQDGASNGYYKRASLDGSRPAIYFINLKSTADWPKYSLPSLTYHEGVPGHHLQISLAQTSGDLPQIRKISFYSAYGEGWALYAEQLADELGAYTGLERAGYLQSYLFRAARLVVDTGIHYKRWSRDKAIDYMVGVTGFTRSRVQREVERYCVMIGQACSYKIGHIAWTKARERARAARGAKWDLREFHEVLKDGAMPLNILDRRIDDRTREILATI